MKRHGQTIYTSIPFQEEDIFNYFRVLSRDLPYAVLLESDQRGRYTIIGLEPIAILKGKNDRLEMTTAAGTEVVNGDVLELVEAYLKRYQQETIPELPDFQGGAIGYISYDYVRDIEHLPAWAKDDLQLPDLYFLVFGEVFVYDRQTSLLTIIVREDVFEDGEARLQNHLRKWQTPLAADEVKLIRSNHSPSVAVTEEKERAVSMTEASFTRAVDKIREYIAAGDVFQVNLSVRQSEPLAVPPISVYEQLRSLNPSPYMSYLQFPEFQVVSGSPELLIKKSKQTLSTRPIAGTRSRGKDEQEDFELAQELINNEKERAEHVMLVDLERNDLGRVCTYGTVHVDEFMTIEKYSHVMHIVSNVTGELAENRSLTDVVQAVFPGGTITGAPKVRTMEIIEELEPVRRGLYTGSIGWIGFNQDMELNIVIRTMLAKDGIAHVQAGAGVVIDSIPKREYKESLKKAKAVWYAKAQSEQREQSAKGNQHDFND